MEFNVNDIFTVCLTSCNVDGDHETCKLFVKISMRGLGTRYVPVSEIEDLDEEKFYTHGLKEINSNFDVSFASHLLEKGIVTEEKIDLDTLQRADQIMSGDWMPKEDMEKIIGVELTDFICEAKEDISFRRTIASFFDKGL